MEEPGLSYVGARPVQSLLRCPYTPRSGWQSQTLAYRRGFFDHSGDNIFLIRSLTLPPLAGTELAVGVHV